jgi:penicillin-binding protein 2
MWLMAVIIAFIVTLILKLWWLQIVDVQKYQYLAQNNRTRHIRDRAQRGRILDRYGTPLATSRPSFSLYIIPEDCSRNKRKTTFNLLADLLNLPADEIEKRFNTRKTATFIPRKVAWNIPFTTVVAIEARKHDLPGTIIQAENIRYYPNGKNLCHLLGYVGEISEKQLKSGTYPSYRPGDILGRTGVERTFESFLNGQDGERWVEVDSTGRVKRTLNPPAPVLPVSGHEITLTIDLDLQRAVEKYLEPWNGAIIVMDPRNGDILALVSRPGYDPNWFASGLTDAQWMKLNQNPKKPLINRSIQMPKSPGSIFKIVTASAAMNTGSINQAATVFCNGAFKLYNTVFRCWKSGGHGKVNIVSALEESCNVYFYQAGLKTGIDSLADQARQFGLGSKTGVDLPNEHTGFMPDREWKKKARNELWWPGETNSVSIGQGAVEMTPLQVANMISAVANRGTVHRPRIVKNITPASPAGNQYTSPKVLSRVTLENRDWMLLHEGLRAVVAGEHGTARKLRMRELDVAGKTGTAQAISKSALKKLGFADDEIPEKFRDHNWFAGFGPVQDPRVAIAVFLENGGKDGASMKIDIARKVFLKWFESSSSSRFGPELPASGKTTGEVSE